MDYDSDFFSYVVHGLAEQHTKKTFQRLDLKSI